MLRRVAHGELAIGARRCVGGDALARRGVESAYGAKHGADLGGVAGNGVGGDTRGGLNHEVAQGGVGGGRERVGGEPQVGLHGWAGSWLVGRRVAVHGDARIRSVGVDGGDGIG